MADNALIIRVATVTASLGANRSRNNTMNSSPPRRTTMLPVEGSGSAGATSSVSRTQPTRRAAASRSKASPAARLRVSLTRLERSRSSKMVAKAKRVFDLDLEHGPNCGEELKIIAAILEQPVIEKILAHLGLQARAAPRAPARGQALQVA